MLPHLSNPPAQHSPGTSGFLSEGRESREHSQSNLESVRHRQLLRRKLTNNLSHLSFLELLDTKLSIIIIFATREVSDGRWLIGIFFLFLWPDLTCRPAIQLIKGGYLADLYWSIQLSRQKTLCHIVSGTLNHWPHSSPPPFPFASLPTYYLHCKQKVWADIFIVYLLVKAFNSIYIIDNY